MHRTRRLGRRLFGPDFDYILFTRPAQWPILTAQFAVGVLCAPEMHELIMTHSIRRLLMPGPGLWIQGGVVAWLAWVVCLNGGTLAYNSAWDRDTTDVAYLRNPPRPPRHLAAAGLLLMAAAVPLAAIVDARYALLAAVCVLFSVLYSRPRPRLKGVPGADLAINMLGYGGGTTLAGLLTGQALAYADPAAPAAQSWWLVAGFAALFGSFYPLTQLYQLEDDRARGDRTLSTALGARRALDLALVLGVIAVACLLRAVATWNAPLGPLMLVLGYWLVLLTIWRVRVARFTSAQHETWMYIALVIWGLIDAVLLVTRYLDRFI